MIITNYNVQKDLYEFLSAPFNMGIDTINGQVYLTRKLSPSEEMFYPYDRIEDAAADYKTIQFLYIGNNYPAK
jgi:hypothetical protein